MFVKARTMQYHKSDRVIAFDLSWDGAWCDKVNHDGVYVFIKYQVSEGEYISAKIKHVSLASLGNKRLGFEFESKITDAGLGFFVYPTTSWKGPIHLHNICVSLDVEGDLYLPDFEVFTLEMVYIPQDKHYIGDPKNGISQGGTLKNCFYTYPNKGAFLIESEDEIAFGPQRGRLYADLDTPNGRQGADEFVIPAEFPKGFDAMWYMKYPLTEAQFVKFINCLTRQQQQSHLLSDISGEKIDKYYAVSGTDTEWYRCAVACRRTNNTVDKPITFFTAAPQRAMNVMSWNDVSAFACFAGLRPITELEFEKACRGPLPAVANEFAWGTTNIGRVLFFDGPDGSGDERPVSQIPDDLVNCNFGTGIAPFERDVKDVSDNPGWIGPVSVNLFERSRILREGLTERERTGVSYYGVAQLSGNVWENLITTGNEEGRSFRKTYGTGELTSDGKHDVETWPNPDTAVGIGVRGGVFISPSAAYVHMALRVFAAHTKAEKRGHGGVRLGY